MTKPTCQKCGVILGINTKFCGVCGTKIETSKLTIKKETSSKKLGIEKNNMDDVLEREADKITPEYNVTNALEKIQLGYMRMVDINFNLIPDILIHHHDDLVKSHRMGSGKNSNKELRDLCGGLIQSFNEFKHGDQSTNEEISERITNSKKIKQEYFTYLLNTTKSFIEGYKKINNVIDELISKNIGNKEILNRLKKIIDRGTFLPTQPYRYFLFCSLEFEKKKILDSGEVPIGWLPMDTDYVYQSMLVELEKSKSHQGNINLLLGTGVIASAWFGWNSD